MTKMNNVIFATTRHHYDSYSDFRRLIELSGYPLVFVDEIDPNDATKTYIVSPLNGEWEGGWPFAKARIILWDLEWRHERPDIPGVSEVWASDPWYAQSILAKFVLLGSHPDLNPDPTLRDGQFDYDVAFLAYMGPYRRQSVQGEFAERGFRLAPNGWGEERHNILSKTRLMVHVHQLDEFQCIAPQRWAIAAAYKMPLISEWVRDPVPELDCCQMFSYALAASVKHSLDNGGLVAFGENLYEVLCVEHTFRQEVEAAL